MSAFRSAYIPVLFASFGVTIPRDSGPQFDAARGAGTVMTCLMTADIVREVLLGHDGALDAAGAGLVVDEVLRPGVLAVREVGRHIELVLRADRHQLQTFAVGFRDPAWDESSLAAHADHIVVLEQGRVIEMGTLIAGPFCARMGFSTRARSRAPRPSSRRIRPALRSSPSIRAPR